ncbi:ABC transporter permease [Nocardia transvalensis]|uniref:ABC transporter permease n=1 Tax=Nocardia transvalensis TaxID=37333 RepID=UPI001893AE73|nr:ABC transporter permease [Nocardia transvalensis]MBF6332530.1 ABC transporter permease [Nocardia transvalensis]
MIGRAVANEFAKMRHLHVVPIAIVLVVGVVGLSSIELTSADFADSVRDPSGLPWHRLLVGMTFAVPLATPILLAVLASRQVDIEHQGNGWLWSHTSGLTPGYLCRVKFVATGAVLVAATLVASCLMVAIGRLAGITAAFPAGQWLGYTASIVVVNLVLLALHLLLSAWLENQLVAMGIGVVGVFLAVVSSGAPPWLAHLSPWGYYSLAAPVDYRDGGLVSLTPAHLSVVALGLAGAVVFTIITRRFDRQEA